MFTGIVEARGTVRELAGTRLVIGCPALAEDAAIGDSIAVNGVCLTVVTRDGGVLAFDLSEETIARTGLRRLSAGAGVNLERPVTLLTRLGGHLVQGHVDGVGSVDALEPDPSGGVRITVRIPDDLSRYVVEKGSITIDGVSLTVAALSEGAVTIALIPHTLSVTTLGAAEVGDPVNIEVDVIAKYTERLIGGTA